MTWITPVALYRRKQKQYEGIINFYENGKLVCQKSTCIWKYSKTYCYAEVKQFIEKHYPAYHYNDMDSRYYEGFTT